MVPVAVTLCGPMSIVEIAGDDTFVRAGDSVAPVQATVVALPPGVAPAAVELMVGLPTIELALLGATCTVTDAGTSV